MPDGSRLKNDRMHNKKQTGPSCKTGVPVCADRIEIRQRYYRFKRCGNRKRKEFDEYASAACGSKLTITACGHDAEDALKALNDLVDRRFDEE